MVFIHQDFKEDLKTIRLDLQTKFAFKADEIDSMPNEQIIIKLKEIFASEHNLNNHRLISDSWQDYYINLILDNVVSIDDSFIRLKDWLFRRTGLTDLINTIEQQSTEAEIFKANKIVRVCSSDKLRTLNLSSIREYIWRHYQVVTYDKTLLSDDILDSMIHIYSTRARRLVYVQDAYGNWYSIPQCVLVPTSIKDLLIYERKILLEKIIDDLKDNAKYRLTELSDIYSEKLREFMEASKKLEQNMVTDYTQEAERILEIQLNIKSILEKNEQITDVKYIMGKELIIETVPLFCGTNKVPIGRYRITIPMKEWSPKAINMDIGHGNWFQHPHIQSTWSCCLGEYISPMRTSFSKWDYITLVGFFIEFLESLNEQSVYQSMENWQHDNYKRFIPYLDKQPKVAKQVNGESPNIIIIDDPDITPEPDMVVSFDLANRAERIASPVPRTLDEAIANRELEMEQADNRAAMDVAEAAQEFVHPEIESF